MYLCRHGPALGPPNYCFHGPSEPLNYSAEASRLRTPTLDDDPVTINPPEITLNPDEIYTELRHMLCAYPSNPGRESILIGAGTLAFFGEEAIFSNFHQSVFWINGQRYWCVEQRYQSTKALMVHDYEMYECILDSSTPAQMKRLAKRIDLPKGWNTVKPGIMFEALCQKFSQNSKLDYILRLTSGLKLVEANPNDFYWSSGTSISDPRTRSNGYYGRNLLGIMLMHVRDENYTNWPKLHTF